VEEYQVLFQSLFDNSHKHYKVVEALYDKKQGLSRTALIKKTKLPSGGSLTNILHELEESGFIEDVIPYQKNKTKSLYKLVDNFTIFYLKFMNGKTTAKWMNLVKTQSWISWSALAFERVCSAHIPQIKKALKLEAIASSTATWQSKQEEQGAQIDLLVDRADRVVNICEIKFSNADFRITKDYARKLRNKLYLFASLKSSKRKTLFLTMVTTFGTVQNEYYKELVQSEVTLEDLFQ